MDSACDADMDQTKASEQHQWHQVTIVPIIHDIESSMDATF